MLLDFALLYEADRAQDIERSVEFYQGLFPGAEKDIEQEHARLSADHAHSGVLDPDKVGQRIAHYVLERELGHGGQGDVYLATDTHVRRQVALKVLRRANLRPDTLRRFRREVEAIAKLDHPALCAVYEASFEGPRPYLAMRYVDGIDLARQIAAQKAAPTTGALVHPQDVTALTGLLQVFERAARGLHAAHGSGVLHRDVKPGNILVRKNGEPVIVDFGLARADDEIAGLTQSADLLGTPAYMAPELLESGHSTADRRADVYSLGVALYECLTLERPFRAESRETIFHQILSGEYEDPSLRNSLVGDDLRVVLATAMERDASRRYATALEFAEDLRRVRVYEPIRARPATRLLRMRRWSQRNPRIAMSAALLFATLCMWIVALRREMKRVEAERSLLQAANERLQGVQFRALSEGALAVDPGLALTLASEAERREPGFDSNMALLHALLRCHEERTLGNIVPMCDLDLSPDGRQVLVVSDVGDATLLDSLSGREVRRAPGLHGEPSRLPRFTARFSPRGDLFLIGGNGSPVCVFDSDTGALRRTLHSAGERCLGAEFSPDGRRILTGSTDGRARVYDAYDGALMSVMNPDAGYLGIAHFDASGAHVVTATDFVLESAADAPRGHDPRVWNTESGALLATLRGHDDFVREARFSPDGRTLVSVDVRGAVRAFDWSSATQRWTAQLPGAGWSLDFSPDSRQVALGFENGVRLFACDSGAALFDLDGLTERAVLEMRYSPDGRWIAARDYGGNVGAWSSVDGATRFRTTCPSTGKGTLAWFGDSKRFATCAGSSLAHVWRTDPFPYLITCVGHQGAVRSAVFDPSSRFVLSAGEDGITRVWSCDDGAVARQIEWNEGPLERAWFLPGGREIACLTGRCAVLTADSITGERRTAYRGGFDVTASTVAADGESLAFGCADGSTLWVDVRSAAPLASVHDATARIERVALSLDGQYMAWSAEDGLAGIVQRRGERHRSFAANLTNPSNPSVFGLGFSRDGLTLFTSADESRGRQWSVGGGDPSSEFPVRPFDEMIALGSGGYLVAWAWVPGLVRLAPTTLTIDWVSSPPTPGVIDSLRVSRDERLFVVAARDGVAEVRRVEDGKLCLRYEHGSSPLTCAEFSPDDRWVVTAAEDGSVRVWPVDVAAFAHAHVPATPGSWALQKPFEEQ